MMASSAAVLSSNMGLYQINMNAIRDIQIILGINMGRTLVAHSFGSDSTSVSYLCSNYVRLMLFFVACGGVWLFADVTMSPPGKLKNCLTANRGLC
jgi:hypothetical protein